MGTNLYTFSFKLILFILVFSGAYRVIGQTYENAAANNLVNIDNQKRFDEFYETEANTLDLIFLGSSHSYCTFDPALFDDALGLSSYQMGMPLQHPDCTYFTLLDVLQYQSPKTIVMEVYWDMLDEDFELTQVNMLLEVMNNEALEKDIFNEVFPYNEKIKYFIKPVRFQTSFFGMKNKEMLAAIEEKFDVKKPEAAYIGDSYYKDKGYIYSDVTLQPDEYDKTNQFKTVNGKGFAISRKQKLYLEKIIDTCKENNIRLIFVTAPVANVSLSLIENYEAIHNTIAAFSAENGIDYYDFNIINQEKNLLANDDFRDDAHLNHNGAAIVSQYLIDLLY